MLENASNAQEEDTYKESHSLVLLPDLNWS